MPNCGRFDVEVVISILLVAEPVNKPLLNGSTTILVLDIASMTTSRERKFIKLELAKIVWWHNNKLLYAVLLLLLLIPSTM